MSRLPKWASEEINRLNERVENQREYFSKKLKEMCGDTPTKIKLDLAHDVSGFVPAGTRVCFTTRNGDEIMVYLSSDGDRVEIFKNSYHPCGGLMIFPRVTNVVEVQ